ncbi:rhomboid family protein [Polaribacter sargassicola]|uniref:rhomboid family protein n=1 Tax=Polaribacter sargassicola TaxID=2836891 RepID=UPI001F33BA4D|nr:rhomboid family intramembrane serine protease [Polaribacter sp. DS7-9]MCG1036916.1 rhomboid family intramembrane serine protease [Polaribacter sp. DS7-9]
MSFIDNIKSRYKGGNIVEKLIYINIAVFVLMLLINTFSGLYNSDSSWFIKWFSLDDNYSALLTKPWTIITYGFLHAGFIHILFNLIALYYIGNLFIEYFTQKQLLSFYLLGTLFGGLFYLLSQNYFPLFQGRSSYLVGASAGISAIFVGIATYLPNYQLKIRFIGFVKLWHLTAIWIALDVLGLSGDNAGGHFAHLGGALLGFLYVNQSSNKKLKIWDKISAIFSSKKKPLKTVYKSPKKTTKSNKNSSLTQQQIDAILDKISKSGYDTLSKAEKEFLFKQGKK